MAKEKEKIELKTIDEQAPAPERLIRLHKDTVEEVVEMPTLRVEGKVVPEARLLAPTRDEKKTRSIQPDIGSLIERDEINLEENWISGPSKRLPWGWFILIGTIFAVGIIWSLVEVNRSKERRGEIVVETESILEKEKSADDDAARIIENLEKAAKDFLASTSTAELLTHSRQPNRVKPLMEDYYARQPLTPAVVSEVTSLDPLTIMERADFWMVSCLLDNGKTSQILMEVMPDGTVKADWETYVCYQPMAWDDLVKTRPDGFVGDFRVYVQEDHFYAYEFADSGKWTSFQLIALDSDESLFGYAERGSALEATMLSILSENQGAVPLILRLEVPVDSASKRGVIIRKLINPRWIFTPSSEEKESH